MEYYYRRHLSPGELLPALGVAVAAGVFAFYVTRLLLQRTPLKIDRPSRHGRMRGRALERLADA